MSGRFRKSKVDHSARCKSEVPRAGDPGAGLNGLIKVRTAHEITAPRTEQLAFLIVQFMPAAWTPAPVFTLCFARQRICFANASASG
jgi:hypothetical protein